MAEQLPKLPKLSQEFRDFLAEAKQHGYGSPNAQQRTTDSGAKEITYSRDLFLYVDNFVGGNPYSGYEHVSVKIGYPFVPVWSMSYYETLKSPEITDEELAKVLGQVLSQPKAPLPIRGPGHWEEGDYEYVLTSEGALEKFEAEERIVHKENARRKKVVYTAKFIGGLVNLKATAGIVRPTWLESWL